MNNYYNEIKNELVNYEVTKKVKEYSINKSELETKYNVGKLLIEAGKHYGEGIIKEYSEKLTKELGKGYSKRNLWLMIKFYELNEKMQTLSAHLTYSHYVELVPYSDKSKIKYYINICEKQNLSVRQLREKIKSKEYERLSEETKNKLSLDNTQEYQITDFVKNPIIIKNYENVSEKVLQKLILEDLESFMKELGEGFCFIGSEYKIKLGNRYNYIDLLLFNIKYNSYVVVELKTTELKKERIGQVEVYMNYIDSNVKTIYQDKTIGIIISKEDNKYIIKYCSDKRIYNTSYILS